MKANWQSASVAESFIAGRLRWNLRFRMIGSWVWLVLEVASFVLLAVLAALQVAMGQHGVAAALIVLDLVAITASVWARRSPLRKVKGSLMELIDLTIHRARRSERFAWAQYLTTAACMAYVVVLYYSGVGDSLAAYHDADRVGAALIVFALYAVGVAIYHRNARRRSRRFLELRRQLAAQPDA